MKSFRPKEGSGEPPASGRNGGRDFRGQRRTNATRASTTDPEARLHRKGRIGWAFTLVAAACNLIRLPKLAGAGA